MKIALAGIYPQGTLEALKRALPKDEFEWVEVKSQQELDALGRADAVILRILKMPERTISQMRGLRLILRWGSGYDSVDIRAAGRRGIAVCNTPGANAKAVAEMTLLLILAVERKLFCHREALLSGNWSKTTFGETSFTLNQKTVGILGGGHIGRVVAEYVQMLGARTLYYDPFRMSAQEEAKRAMRYTPMDMLLAESDLITLHLPLTEQSRHLINAERLAMMKSGAILINAARGGLVDDRALLRAIQTGHLGGAGLDCVEEEPLPAEHPLLHDPRIIITPHIAGGTADLGTFILPMLVENLLALKAGSTLRYMVNQPDFATTQPEQDKF